jgi:uncharacterized protein YjdB
MMVKFYIMKTIFLFSVICLVVLCAGHVSARVYTPKTHNNMSGGGAFCQGVQAGLIKFRYNTCHTDNGVQTGILMTAIWYRNTTNSTSGGTAVSATTVYCATAGRGSVAYLPSTTATGTFYYYCVLTWAGAGTCNTAGSLTSAVTAQVIVNANPQPIAGNTTTCVGATTSLSDAAGGGKWTSSNTGIASVNVSTGLVTGIAYGTAVISYSTNCGTPATVTVIVTTAPTAILGASYVCTGQDLVLSDAVIGGTWSSNKPAVAIAGSSSGIVTGVASGTCVITYATGCGTAVTKSITVNTSPVAILGASLVCTGSTATLSDATAGGTWSSTVTTVATIGSTGIVRGVAAGTTVISYTNGTCAATKMVSVNSAPGAISGSSSVCEGQTISLTDAVTGGTWSSSNTNKATVDAVTGVVTGVANGNINISYNTGCGTAASKAITVNNSPAAPTGTAALCAGATTILHGSPSGGTWSSGNTAIATISSSGTNGTVYGVAGGTALISYINGGCPGVTTVTVNPLPNAGVISGTTICEADQLLLTETVAGGTWSSSNLLVAAVDSFGVVWGLSAGTTTISYAVTNSCGTSYAALAITVNGLPDAGFISGPSSVCAGKTISLTDTTAGGVWSSSNITIATVSAGGITTGILAGSVVISYVATNGCGSDYAASPVTVQASPLPITGTATVCAAGTVMLSDATAGGTWSSSDIDVAAINPVTGEVTGESAGSAVISYSLGSGCAATTPAIVNVAPTTITGVTTMCTGYSEVLSNPVAGGVWSSTSPSVATIAPSSGIVRGIAPGTSTVSYTLGSGCTITSPVTIISATQPITGITTVCTGLKTSLTSGGDGTWSSSAPTVAFVDAVTGVVSGISAGTALISYTLPCGTVSTVVTVNSSRSAPAVSSMSPVISRPSTSVSISGTNFSTVPGKNVVYFGSTRAIVSSSSGTALSVTVPVGATHKTVYVDNTECGLSAFSPKSFLPVYDNSAYVAGTINFANAVEFIAGIHPFSLAIGDLDGDGKSDVAVLNVTSNTVSVFRNTSTSGAIGTSSFANKVDFATGVQPFGIAIGDIDGDGKLDMVVANDVSNTISLFRNTATAGTIDYNSFAAKVDFATGINPVSVAIADIDRDGKPDIAVANYYSNTISLFRNTSATGGIAVHSLAAKVDIATGNRPYSLALADIDGDGKVDIAAANSVDNTISLFRNSATSGSITAASFESRVDFIAGTQPYCIAIADIDGDGKADIAVTNAISRTVSVFRNTATSGSLTSASLAAKVDLAAGVLPYSIAIGDINGDGKPDLVVSNYGNTRSGTTSVSVFRNTAITGAITTASFAGRVDIAVKNVPRSVVVGDLDGDSKPDLALACLSSNTFIVLRNSPLYISGGYSRGEPAPIDTLTGMKGAEPVCDVKVIPNPNSGEFILHGSIGTPEDKVAITVTDMLGRIIYNGDAPVDNGNIDNTVSLSASVSGLYVVGIHSRHVNKAYLVVIEK